MNITQMQYFKKLAETQHYSQSSEELGIAQSSLSRSINALENQLGVMLFEKHGRNVHLTKYGAVLYEYVRDSLASLELGIRKVKSMTDPTEGEICVGLTFPLGPTIVPGIIQRFTSDEKNRDFLIRLYQNSSQELVSMLKSGKCDVALCSYVPDEPEIQFTPLLPGHLVAVVSQTHPLAASSTISLKAMAQYPFILNSDQAHALLQLFHQNGLYPTVLAQVQGECAIIGLVSVNYGISIVNRTADLTGMAVKVLTVPELEDVQFPVHMAYVKNRWFPPAVKTFMNFLLKDVKAYLF